MIRLRRTWGLPLTAKELAEMAGRRRTYLLRAGTGVLLGIAFAVACVGSGRHGLQAGAGREVLTVLTLLLAWIAALAVPAGCAACIAGEREDGSLQLVRLTMLGPWAVVLEKWLSRLIPGLGLVLVAAPLLALAYALGGFEPWLIGCAVAAIATTILQAAAIGICASAWAGGTVGAVVLGYVLMAALYALPPLAAWAGGGGWANPHPLSPPLAFAGIGEVRPWGPPPTPYQFWLTCAWTLASTAVALGAARIGLDRRAPSGGANLLLAWFRGLDRRFEDLERRLLGRTVARELPRDRPVAWRECHRRTLTSPRYLARILIPVSVAVVVAVTLAIGLQASRFENVFMVATMLIEASLWIALLVLGATAFASERANDSLPVLLTTPMGAREILAQKISGLRRVHAAGILVLLLVGLLRWWLAIPAGYNPSEWSPGVALLTAVTTPALLAWTGVLAGLLVRSRARAITAAIGAAALWTVSGGAVAITIDALHPGGARDAWYITALNPVFLPLLNADGHNPWQSDGLAVAAYAMVHIPLWLALRTAAHLNADRLLRKG